MGHAREIVLPVAISERQQECCGEEFAVGDEVVWRLWVDEANGREYAPAAHIVEVELEGSPMAGQRPGWYPTLVRRGDLVALWEPPRRIDGCVRLRAVFGEDHHEMPDDVPATHGTVRRIREEWTPRPEVRHSDDSPVPVTIWNTDANVYRDVRRCLGNVYTRTPADVGRSPGPNFSGQLAG